VNPQSKALNRIIAFFSYFYNNARSEFRQAPQLRVRALLTLRLRYASAAPLRAGWPGNDLPCDEYGASAASAGDFGGGTSRGVCSGRRHGAMVDRVLAAGREQATAGEERPTPHRHLRRLRVQPGDEGGGEEAAAKGADGRPPPPMRKGKGTKGEEAAKELGRLRTATDGVFDSSPEMPSPLARLSWNGPATSFALIREQPHVPYCYLTTAF
jgi:hypothetical protein